MSYIFQHTDSENFEIPLTEVTFKLKSFKVIHNDGIW